MRLIEGIVPLRKNIPTKFSGEETNRLLDLPTFVWSSRKPARIGSAVRVSAVYFSFNPASTSVLSFSNSSFFGAFFNPKILKYSPTSPRDDTSGASVKVGCFGFVIVLFKKKSPEWG